MSGLALFTDDSVLGSFRDDDLPERSFHLEIRGSDLRAVGLGVDHLRTDEPPHRHHCGRISEAEGEIEVIGDDAVSLADSCVAGAGDSGMTRGGRNAMKHRVGPAGSGTEPVALVAGVEETRGMGPELAIADAFGLGGVHGCLVPAAAGWGGHNTLYRLVTSTGTWAVKRHGWGPMPDAARAFAIETEAYQGGVPMARPVPARDGRCWVTIDGDLYRCHEWVDGEAKDNEETSADEASAMGGIVAQLHSLRIRCSVEGSGTQRQGINRQRWDELAAAGRTRNAPWADRLRDASETLGLLETEPGPAERGEGELVGSHGDLNAHNVLFSAGALRLIDWDGAGPAWPRWERANYAVLWAQRGHGRYDAEAVLAFLRGYLDAGGTLEADDPIALRCASAALVPWVVQNIGMALDRPTAQQDVLTGLLIKALLAMPRTIAVRQALLAECLGRL